MDGWRGFQKTSCIEIISICLFFYFCASCFFFHFVFWPQKFVITLAAHWTGETLWAVSSAHIHAFFFVNLSLFLFFPLFFLSVSPYVGQCMCIDIFSVYRSPESRIGDHPRNRLSHFYVLKKWSGQVLSSISLSLTGSPPFKPFSCDQWQRAVKSTPGLLQSKMDRMSRGVGT